MITVDVIIKRKMSFGKGQFICALCVFWLFSLRRWKTKLHTLHSSARKSHFLDVSFLLELKNNSKHICWLCARKWDKLCRKLWNIFHGFKRFLKKKFPWRTSYNRTHHLYKLFSIVWGIVFLWLNFFVLNLFIGEFLWPYQLRKWTLTQHYSK